MAGTLRRYKARDRTACDQKACDQGAKHAAPRCQRTIAIRKVAPRPEAVSRAEAGMHRAEAAAHTLVRQAAARTRAAGHSPVRQAAVHSRAAADTARHRGGICGHTAPGASPAGTPSAGRKRSSRARPTATQSNSQYGRSCRDFPIPRLASYDGIAAEFGRRT